MLTDCERITEGRRGRSVVVGLAAVVVGLGLGTGVAVADPSVSPELVPFTGTRTITATWGAPSGGYHAAGDAAIDVAMPIGTPIYAAGAGRVTRATVDNRVCNPALHPGGLSAGVAACLAAGYGGGTQVRIQHPDGRASVYLHLSGLSVIQEQQVSAGQQIGVSGNTGITTGAHLHYGEIAGGANVDPGVWVACHGATRVEYGGLQARVNQSVRNDGYGCNAPPPVQADSDYARNGSFEQGTEHWVRGANADKVNVAGYTNAGYAKEGARYLEANTSVAGGSIAQDITVPAGEANRSYTASVWVRKAPGVAGSPRGALALWDLGAGPRNGQTAVTLTDRWQLVSAPISITGTGATTLRIEFYMATPGVNYDFDGAQLVRSGLRDASFDLGGGSWSRIANAAKVNVAAYNNAGYAREGNWYLQANTAVPSGSFGQDVPVPAGPAGRSYTFSMWVRRPAGTPPGASGTLRLWDLGSSGPRGYSTSFTLTDEWSLVSAPIWVETTGATTLRTEVYMDTTGVNYDFDAAQLVRTGLLNASFEQGTPGWGRIANADKVNLAGYTTPGRAREGVGFIEANTSVPSGSIGQDAGVPEGPAGRSFTLAVWVRKAPGVAGNPTGTLALWDLGGGPAGGSTPFTATDQWQLVTAPVTVAGTGATTLRAEVYMGTTGVNYNFDGATLAPGNQALLEVPSAPGAGGGTPGGTPGGGTTTPGGGSPGGGTTPGSGTPGSGSTPSDAPTTAPRRAVPALKVTTLRPVGRRLNLQVRLSRAGVLRVRLVGRARVIQVSTLRVRSPRTVRMAWALPARYPIGRYNVRITFTMSTGSTRSVSRPVTFTGR